MAAEIANLAHRNRGDFCDFCDLRCPSRTPEIARFPRQEKAMLHCDLSVRWKVASDLRFWAAISEPETPSFCGISGDLAQSTRKSLAIAIVRFWCAKFQEVPPQAFPIGRLTLRTALKSARKRLKKDPPARHLDSHKTHPQNTLKMPRFTKKWP